MMINSSRRIIGKIQWTLGLKKSMVDFGAPTSTHYQRPNSRCASTESKSTVINDEVSKFGGRSKQWWDPNGMTKPLHKLNVLRVPFARDGILDTLAVSDKAKDARHGPRPLQGFTIADIGCGAGLYSEALARIGADVTGIDASPDLIETARQHAKLDANLSSNLRYVNTTPEEHVNGHSGLYDAVVCSEVIEHVDNKEFFVEQCVKLVKSGGSLLFTTINQTLAAWLVMIFAGEYVLRVIIRGTHHYRLLMPHKDLENMLVKNGCHIRSLQGMLFKHNSEWTYIKSVNICYCMHAVKK